MNDTKKKKNTTKQKQKFKTIVITFVVFIVIIAVVIVACVKCANRGNTPDNGNSASSTVNVKDYIEEDEYLKINAEDCTIYVDSVIKLTCSSNPVEYSMGVSWTSSDTSVLTVTYDGTVTAIKEGIAVVTATHGVMSSSIIVQVIAQEETPDEEFPIYTPVIPDATTAPGEPEITTTAPTGQAGNENGSQSPTQETTTPAVKPSEGESKPAENETTKTEQPTTEKVTQPSSTTSPEETETVGTRDNIINTLPECGFNSYIGDTYVFEEDGNYLGQVIVEQEFTQLYVMTRTTYFDSKIREFLQVILPTGHSVAFNNFVNSQKDMTFSIDGHRVRVIASPNGGHSQLIIYH